MRKSIILICLLCSWASGALAEQFEGTTVDVKVNGMVCDFCARGLEKTLAKKDSVDSIKVDLESGTITIFVRAGHTLPDAEITQAIKDNGISVVSIAR